MKKVCFSSKVEGRISMTHFVASFYEIRTFVWCRGAKYCAAFDLIASSGKGLWEYMLHVVGASIPGDKLDAQISCQSDGLAIIEGCEK